MEEQNNVVEQVVEQPQQEEIKPEKTFTQAEVIVCNIIIDHMQELEKVDK